jgi:hypothetical protein
MSAPRELRFTRSGQARLFWILAAMFAAAALTLVAASLHRESNPGLPHGAWALPPLLLAIAAASLAAHLTRHAYIVLTLVGIEIYPFFRPASRMRLLLWPEIDSAEVDQAFRVLTLHMDPGKTSGLHLALEPVRNDRRQWLASAIMSRLESQPRRSARQDAQIEAADNTGGQDDDRGNDGAA